MKKNIIAFVCLLFLFLNLQCQKKNTPIDLSRAEIKITNCGIFYKGQELKLGVPISEWEKVLGKVSRKATQNQVADVWDSLGIAVADWNYNPKGVVSEFYVFFTNLDSEEGKKGKLSLAGGRRSYEDIEEEYKSINKPISKELENDIKNAIEPSKNFAYPYTIFSGVVDLQGAPLQTQMSLQQMNQYREKLGLSVISFRDDNMNGWDESGTLTGEYGNYFTIGTKICPDGNAFLFIIRFSEYKPEYLRVLLQDKHEKEYQYDKDGNEYK